MYVEHEPLEQPSVCHVMINVGPWQTAPCGKPAVVVQTTHAWANTWHSQPVCEEHKKRAEG